MRRNIKLFVIGTFVAVILIPFFLTGCASQPAICPELTVKFCPAK